MNLKSLNSTLKKLVKKIEYYVEKKQESISARPSAIKKSANSITGIRARVIMEDLRSKIFAEALYTFIIRDRLRYLAARDRTYFEQRETSSFNVNELVEYMCTINLDTPGMREVVRSQPTMMQSFLLDRFIYVDEYLGRFPQQEFFIASMEEFLRWGLIDIWKTRVKVGEWM